MIARITTGLWFLFYGMAALFHVPVGGLVLAILAFIAGIAILCGA